MNKSVCFIVILLLFAVFFSAGCVSTASDDATPNPTSTQTLIPLVDNPLVSSVTNTPTAVPTQTPTPVVTSTPTPVITSTPTPTKTVTSTTTYYVNKESEIVHKDGCSYIKDLSNYFEVTDPSGYQKCSRCW